MEIGMKEETSAQDLTERLKLIEVMIREGKRTTTQWGWTFVLWGVAYYVATGWATWGHFAYAWPVTMVAAALTTAIAASRMKRGQPGTTLGRSVGGVWWAMSVSIIILLMSLGFSGRYDGHVYVAIIGAMLGLAHMASAIVLKWKPQYFCAAVWYASTVIACFGSNRATTVGFLGATFLGQIVFGVYAMTLEARRRRDDGAAHA